MGDRVEVTSELTASVIKVLVSAGDAVGEGDPLVVVESMKMEIPVPSPVTGTVEQVAVAPADRVLEGDVVAVVQRR